MHDGSASTMQHGNMPILIGQFSTLPFTPNNRQVKNKLIVTPEKLLCLLEL
jgi:hypothetical protein